jgi:hypothetical protein
VKAARLGSLAVLLAVWGAIGAAAQEQPETGQPAGGKPAVSLTVEQIARQAQSRNLDIRKAELAVVRARKDLAGEPELNDSSVSVSGGYRTGATGTGGWYAQSGVSLPVAPQLSVGGELSVEDEALQEELSLSVTPFSPRRQTYAEEQAYKDALVAQRYLRRSIYLQAEQAALNLLIRDMERELARLTLELELKKYELVQRRQELGEVSFQDVQDQLLDLIKARRDLFDSEQSYLSDWKALQLLFAPRERSIAVVPLAVEELLQMVKRRGSEAAESANGEPATENLESLRLELIALQKQLKATPAWRPDLNLSAGLVFPDVSPSVSMALSFSPNQLKRDERRELAEDIEIKRMEIAAESYGAELQKTLGQQSIAIAEQALESARIQRERDRVALREAELLFQQGGRTTLELEQLRLNLRRSEISSFQAAVDDYRALGEYLMLFVSGTPAE